MTSPVNSYQLTAADLSTDGDLVTDYLANFSQKYPVLCHLLLPHQQANVRPQSPSTSKSSNLQQQPFSTIPQNPLNTTTTQPPTTSEPSISIPSNARASQPPTTTQWLFLTPVLPQPQPNLAIYIQTTINLPPSSTSCIPNLPTSPSLPHNNRTTQQDDMRPFDSSSQITKSDTSASKPRLPCLLAQDLSNSFAHHQRLHSTPVLHQVHQLDLHQQRRRRTLGRRRRHSIPKNQ